MDIVVYESIHPPFPSHPLPPPHQKERNARGAWKGIHSFQGENKTLLFFLSVIVLAGSDSFGRVGGQRLCITEERIKRRWWTLHMEAYILTKGTQRWPLFIHKGTCSRVLYYLHCS